MSARAMADVLQPRAARDSTAVGVDRTARARESHAFPARVPDKSGRAIESILVATDFSERAAHAMERAILLAHDLAPARAGLLHVAPASPLPAFSRKPDGHDGRQTAATRIRALARHVQERTGLRVDTRVVVGKVVPTLREFASEADLTIVAGPPARPLRDLTIGSPVQRLSRRLERPLLVVNQPARQSYRQVVVAVDLSNDPGNALAAARALAPGAKLNLLHVYRAPYEGQLRYAGASEEAIYSHRAEARTSAASALTTLVLSHLPADEVRLLLAHGHPLPKLLEKTCDVGADLIVVTRSEPSLMRELLVESVTAQVLGRSRCDVLVVP